MDKKALRKEYFELRDKIPTDKRIKKSQKIFEILKANEAYQKANIIFIYASFHSEVYTHEFIKLALEDKKIICLPVVISDQEMEVFQIHSMDQLKKDNFGILSPDPNSCSKVLPEEIDLALIPLLAFNAQGYRLGYGKGYYDRYLPQLKATCNKIGIAFSEQFSKELPVSIYDYPLDHILTENGFSFITERIETHSHCSEFSPDSERSFEDFLLEANKKNYSYLTLTDHFDKDVIDGHVIRSDKDDLYTPRENEWIMPLSSYIDFCVQKKKELENKPDSTQLLIGIELGYQDYLLESFKQIVNQYPFDCVIGSIHTMFKYDFAVFSEPLYGLGKEKAYQAYLETILELAQSDLDFDILAHFDYVTRYAPYDDPYFYYQDYPELFDQIFMTIIKKEIALEVNTRTRYRGLLSGKKDWGIADLNIYQRYYDLGGRMISFATDAHQSGNLHLLISDSIQQIKKIGFTKGTYFINRKPKFYDL